MGRRAGIITAGFPCQDVSVAGGRLGLATGTRSGLYRELVRLADSLNPEWLVIENVPGLLSTDGGAGFAMVLGDLTGWEPETPADGWRNSGVCVGPLRSAAWRVLDAQYFGVAQRRRRVFIVCHPRDRAAPSAVLLEPEGLPRDIAPCRPSWASVADGATRRARVGRQLIAESELVSALTGAGMWGGPDVNSAQAGWLVASSTGRGYWDDRDSGATLAARDWRSPNTLAFHVTQDPISGDVAPAMGTGNGQGCATIGVLEPSGVRRLTPLECERLQGFPDHWTLTPTTSDSRRYALLGNAVCVNVAEWIGLRIRGYENDGIPAR